MKSTGRNDPCPCGSGKKYKKCCLNGSGSTVLTRNLQRILQQPAVHQDRPNFHNVGALTTEEIISRLKGFGILFEDLQFQQDVQRFLSAEELVADWFKRFTVRTSGFDDDFIWLACVILWKRLAPDVPGADLIDDLINEGYHCLEQSDRSTRAAEIKASGLWLEAWDLLKQRFLPQVQSVEELDRIYQGSVTLSYWVTDLEAECYNAGRDEPDRYQKRITFCREFCQLLPDSPSIYLQEMRRAEAETYYYLNRKEEGEAAFRSLVEDYPENVWGYIGWGDVYQWRFGGELTPDFDKAEQIYRMAFDHGLGSDDDLQERLKSLNKSRQAAEAELSAQH